MGYALGQRQHLLPEQGLYREPVLAWTPARILPRIPPTLLSSAASASGLSAAGSAATHASAAFDSAAKAGPSGCADCADSTVWRRKTTGRRWWRQTTGRWWWWQTTGRWCGRPAVRWPSNDSTRARTRNNAARAATSAQSGGADARAKRFARLWNGDEGFEVWSVFTFTVRSFREHSRKSEPRKHAAGSEACAGDAACFLRTAKDTLRELSPCVKGKQMRERG